MTTLLSPPATAAGITEDELEAFSYGDCWALALELHNLTGHPLAFYASATHGASNWVHVLLALPDGSYLDVNGVQEDDDLHLSWGEYIWSEEEDEGGIFIPSHEEAVQFVSDQERQYEEDVTVTARKLLTLLP